MEDNKPLDRFTRKQLRGLEDRLAELKAKSHDIAQRIKEAREQGDITENSEYDSAMDDQRKNESEIADLEALLSRSVVIDKIDTKKVSVGCLVTVMNITKNRESTYEIVGSPILVDVLPIFRLSARDWQEPSPARKLRLSFLQDLLFTRS